MPGCGLLFIFDILHRIGTQYLVIHGKIKQPVQPAEATVGLRGTEILVPYKKCLVTFAEVFRYLLKGNVLPAQRGKIVRQVFLEVSGMAVGGNGIYLFAPYSETFALYLTHLQQMGGNHELSCHPGLDDFRADDTLCPQNILVSLFDILPVLLQSGVFPYRACCSGFGVPVFRPAIYTGSDGGTPAVNGDAAHDSRGSVSLYLAAVDVE